MKTRKCRPTAYSKVKLFQKVSLKIAGLGSMFSLPALHFVHVVPFKLTDRAQPIRSRQSGMKIRELFVWNSKQRF